MKRVALATPNLFSACVKKRDKDVGVGMRGDPVGEGAAQFTGVDGVVGVRVPTSLVTAVRMDDR